MKKVFSFLIILSSSIQIVQAQNPTDLHGQIQNPVRNQVPTSNQQLVPAQTQPFAPQQTQPFAPQPSQPMNPGQTQPFAPRPGQPITPGQNGIARPLAPGQNAPLTPSQIKPLPARPIQPLSPSSPNRVPPAANVRGPLQPQRPAGLTGTTLQQRSIRVQGQPQGIQPTIQFTVFQMQPQIQTVIPPQMPLQEVQQILPGLQTQALFQNAFQIQPQNHPFDISKGLYYTVEYDPSSKVKNLPLKNITMSVQVYYNGNPEGRIAIKTDEDQNFQLGELKKVRDYSSTTIEILSLGDQAKFKAKCHGLVTPGYSKIMIKCE